jgi:hypothetical protein
MAMEFLAFDNQRIPGLSPHHQKDNGRFFYIVQYAEFGDAKFILGQWIGPQLFDGPRWNGRLIGQLCNDRVFHQSLLMGREAAKLSLGIGSNLNLIGHFERGLN